MQMHLLVLGERGCWHGSTSFAIRVQNLKATTRSVESCRMISIPAFRNSKRARMISEVRNRTRQLSTDLIEDHLSHRSMVQVRDPGVSC